MNRFQKSVGRLKSQVIWTLSMVVFFMTLNTHTYGQQALYTKSLFDGNTLRGWKSFPKEHQSQWKVQDGLIIGGDGINKIPENIYLYSEEEFEDFEFRCLFRLSGDSNTGMINSGIQYRSKIEDGNMVGYQADIGNGYWGDIYDEHRRGKLIGGDLTTLQHLLKEEGWNSYIIRCKGDLHELYINGVKTASYLEKDKSLPRKGIVAFQLHSGGAAVLELRDLTITHLK